MAKYVITIEDGEDGQVNMEGHLEEGEATDSTGAMAHASHTMVFSIGVLNGFVDPLPAVSEQAIMERFGAKDAEPVQEH